MNDGFLDPKNRLKSKSYIVMEGGDTAIYGNGFANEVDRGFIATSLGSYDAKKM